MSIKREFKDYVDDILDAIEKIESFTQGFTLEQFTSDDKTIFAVIRAFEIIGEAAKRVPDAIKEEYITIPWQEMTDMRDKLIHAYFGINLDVVWETIKKDIPSLKKQIVNLLNKEENKPL